jgi:hypothetical protein
MAEALPRGERQRGKAEIGQGHGRARGHQEAAERARSCAHSFHVVGIGRDALADLLVAALHLGVISIDVLAAEPEELVVVVCFEVMPARAVDRTHLILLIVHATR